jgi:hypothetical protein
LVDLASSELHGFFDSYPIINIVSLFFLLENDDNIAIMSSIDAVTDISTVPGDGVRYQVPVQSGSSWLGYSYDLFLFYFSLRPRLFIRVIKW